MKLSLKYKILGILILLPALALLVFAFMASDMFLKDKMAYIYETSFKHNSSLSENTKFQYEKFNTFLKFNMQLVRGKQELPSSDFYNAEPSIIALRIFKLQSGRLNLISTFKRSKDYIFNKSNIEYQEKFNQLLDGSTIEYNDSTDNLIKILMRDSSSGVLLEGIFKTSDLSQGFKNDKLFYNILVTPSKVFFTKKGMNNLGKNLILKIKEKNNNSGVFESESENSIVSYSSISNGVWIISILEKSKALSVLDVLKTKSILFILAIISLSIIVSVIASRKLTLNLRVLSLAAEEIGKGDFDTQVDIKSNDEVGFLAYSFNNMSSKIASLLNELEEYNRTLEQKVEERTLELKQAMDLQNTILDSVDQGFVLMNKDLSILPVYSKASVNLFDGDPDKQGLSKLLHLEGTQANEIETYFSMAIDEMMPFDDMMLTAPEHFLNKSNREIFLQYMPVRDENKKVDKVVLVATDKTDEIEALKNLEHQKFKVQMVLKIASNSKGFLAFEAQTLKYINSMSELLSNGKNLDKDYIARVVHTIKGNAAVYSLKSIVDLTHEFEENMKNSGLDPKELSQYLQSTLFYLDEIYNEYETIIRPGGKDQDEGVMLLSHEIEMIKKLVDDNVSNERVLDFVDFISKSEVISEKLSTLENEAISMSKMLDKKVEVKVSGKNVRVPLVRFDELFSNMIHLIRNAMDHGIEKSDIRAKTKKQETATLKLSASMIDDQNIEIRVQDDGQGINVEKVEQKLKDNGIDTSSISPEQMPYMIFHDGISTSDKVTDYSGRGVGVSSVKDVVDQMGGSIIIETELGKGTTFIITVPLFENNKEDLILHAA